MANERPTDFPSLSGTNWADSDLITGVDISDTTDSAQGSDIKSTLAEFVDAIVRRFKLSNIATPSTPSDGVTLFSRLFGGRSVLSVIEPTGLVTDVQPSLADKAIFMVGVASGTTAPTTFGGTLTTASTMSMQQTIASANPWLAEVKKRFATSGTAGNASGMRTAYTQWFLGNAAGFGGFTFKARFGQNINLNGAQVFVGLAASTAALGTGAGAVAALVNMLGVGYDTTDASTGNWFFYRNDGTGTATKVDLGTSAARNTTHGYELHMHAAPNSTTVFVRVTNLHSGVVVLDTSYNTNVPAVNTGMAFHADVNNGAVASATNLEVSKVYIESDF